MVSAVFHDRHFDRNRCHGREEPPDSKSPHPGFCVKPAAFAKCGAALRTPACRWDWRCSLLPGPCWRSSATELPGPVSTWHAAVELFADPFYSNGPNDQGIGWNILNSLGGWAGLRLAALIGIPLGFLIGRVKFLGDMFAPIIALLRPVSPLAWLPIGLLVFQAANPAARSG
jgi:hypothetical protein